MVVECFHSFVSGKREEVHVVSWWVEGSWRREQLHVTSSPVCTVQHQQQVHTSFHHMLQSVIDARLFVKWCLLASTGITPTLSMKSDARPTNQPLLIEVTSFGHIACMDDNWQVYAKQTVTSYPRWTGRDHWGDHERPGWRRRRMTWISTGCGGLR